MTYTECLGIYVYPLRLHETGKSLHAYHKFMILANVGKYASPVDPLENMPGT